MSSGAHGWGFRGLLMNVLDDGRVGKERGGSTIRRREAGLRALAMPKTAPGSVRRIC